MIANSTFYALALLFFFGLVGCSKTTNPTNPGDLAARTVLVNVMDSLPMTGGNATSVHQLEGNIHVTVVDGAQCLLNGDHFNQLDASSNFVHAVTAQDASVLYAISNNALHARGYGSTSHINYTVPLPSNGPQSQGATITASKLILADYTPIAVFTNSLGRTYAYFTMDLGVTWRQIRFETPNGPVDYTSTPSDVTSMGSNMYTASGSSNGGLYWSDVPYTLWQKRAGTIPDLPVNALIAYSGRLFTWTPGRGGLRVSRDDGQTFQDLTSLDQPPLIKKMVSTHSGQLYALTTDSLVLRSLDHGNKWIQMYEQPANDISVYMAQVAVAGAMDAQGNGGGVHTSGDGGVTWYVAGKRKADKITQVSFGKDGDLLVLANQMLCRWTMWYEWRPLAASARV